MNILNCLVCSHYKNTCLGPKNVRKGNNLITATPQAQIIPDQISQTHKITTHTLANVSISKDQSIID